MSTDAPEPTRIPSRLEEWMSPGQRSLITAGWMIAQIENRAAHLGHPDVVCIGIVNGMHEPSRDGAYVHITAMWPGENKVELFISRGAARSLADEINGALS